MHADEIAGGLSTSERVIEIDEVLVAISAWAAVPGSAS